LRFWDVATGQQVSSIQGGRGCIAFAPDGKTIAAYNYATVRIWDVVSQQLVNESAAADDWVETFTYSPDGKILAIGYINGQLLLWRLVP
jgi:WD40 repeat protein